MHGDFAAGMRQYPLDKEEEDHEGSFGDVEK